MKQVLKDLCSGSSEKYWKDEGNNRRMRKYHKLSKILKIVRYILISALVIYILRISTNSLICLFDRMTCCNNELTLLSLIDFKEFIYDVYIATFIIASFVVFYIIRSKKYSLKEVAILLMEILLILPVSVLLVYNFVILDSFMRCFYLLVVFSVVMILINQLTNRIDRLYDIAVGSIQLNRKGDKVCKGK